VESPWEFATDAESDAFCREIVAELVRLFSVPAEEAVGRINRHWRGQAFIGADIVYHETPGYWAHVIYMGKDSAWWITGEKRERMGLGPVVPKPYP
jgi:hypothetical protein